MEEIPSDREWKASTIDKISRADTTHHCPHHTTHPIKRLVQRVDILLECHVCEDCAKKQMYQGQDLG